MICAMSSASPCAKRPPLIHRIRMGMSMPAEIFNGVVLPVIQGYGVRIGACTDAYVCHSETSRCPLMTALTVAGAALDYRRGHILPPNAAPEDIGERAHRWTYAVFVSALLLHGNGPGGRSSAHPSAAEGVDGGRTAPAGERRCQPDTAVQDRLSLYKCLVPPRIQQWLEDDKALQRELMGILAGVASVQPGAIGPLVKRAEAAVAGTPAVIPGRNAQPPTDTPKPQALDDQKPLTATPVSAGMPVTADAGCSAAEAFMQWIASGIQDGRLRVNAADAMVHFVPEGMLLVSPRIFKEYESVAGMQGEGHPAGSPDASRPGLSIQRQVIRAGWHRTAANGINVQTYDVLRHGKPVTALSGLLITQPERFISPVPAANPLLRRRLSS